MDGGDQLSDAKFLRRSIVNITLVNQGPCSKLLSGGAKLDDFFGGGVGGGEGVIGNFYLISLVTIKLLIFSHILSDVAIGSSDINL